MLTRLSQNAFWRLGPLSCPHHALSYDIMHYIDGGLWGKHLLVELISIIEEAGHLDTLDAR